MLYNLAFIHVKFHSIVFTSEHKPTKIFLKFVSIFLGISYSTQLCVIHTFDKYSLPALIEVINQNVEEHWSQEWGLWYPTCYFFHV